MPNSFLHRVLQTPVYSAGSTTGGTTMQVHLNALMQARFKTDPDIFRAINNKYIKKHAFMQFIEDKMGRATTMRQSFTNQEYDYEREQVKLGTVGAPFAVPAFTAGTNTVVIPLDVASMQLSANYVMPQQGHFVAVPPTGELLEITAVNANGANPSITVRHDSTTGQPLTLAANAELPYVIGKKRAQCTASKGWPMIPGAPTNYDFQLETFDDAEEWCDTALDYQLKTLEPIKFKDENGELITVNVVATASKIKKMQKFYDSMHMQSMLNSRFGFIPVLKTRGTIIEHASTTQITEDDIYYVAKNLISKGVTCKKYYVICGYEKYIQYQQMFGRVSVANRGINGTYNANDSMKHLNLQWLTLTVGGLELEITWDESFSSGLSFGATGFKYPMAEIWVPDCERPYDAKQSANSIDWATAENPNAMITCVYGKSISTGEVFDCLMTSNGILNGANAFTGERGYNSFDPTERKHKWAWRTDMTQMIHGAQSFCIGGLFS